MYRHDSGIILWIGSKSFQALMRTKMLRVIHPSTRVFSSIQVDHTVSKFSVHIQAERNMLTKLNPSPSRHPEHLGNLRLNDTYPHDPISIALLLSLSLSPAESVTITRREKPRIVHAMSSLVCVCVCTSIFPLHACIPAFQWPRVVLDYFESHKKSEGINLALHDVHLLKTSLRFAFHS